MNKKITIAPMLGAIMNSAKPPRRPSDKQMVKEHARMQKRHATEDWVAGRMSTKEHNATHARADHILSGKHPKSFKGKAPGHRLNGVLDAGM